MNEKLKAEIDALNEEAWRLRVNDSNKAHEVSKRALDLSLSVMYARGQAEALRTLGFTLIRLSQHTEALVYLHQALPLFESLADVKGQSDVYEYYGIIHRSFGDYTSSLDALYKSLELRQQTDYKEGESLSFYHLGVTYRYLGNLEKALDYFLQSLAIGQALHYEAAESYSLNNIGSIYFELSNFGDALPYFLQSLAIRRRQQDKWGEAGCLDNIGYTYFKIGDYEQAQTYCLQSCRMSKSVGDKKGESNALFHLADICLLQKNYPDSKTYAFESLAIRKDIGDKKGEAELHLTLSQLALLSGNRLLAEENLVSALHLAEDIKASDLLQKTHNRCYEFYKQQEKYGQALRHLEASYAFEREIHSGALNQKIMTLEIMHKIEQSKKEAEMFRLKSEELESLNKEIETQKSSLEVALQELKATQVQLIQKEKMASLGELTAGIAHEIQNPLNFVNNFSEVNNELIDDMSAETDAEEIKAIAATIKQNNDKISFHGKRADAIVKGMLQHSRQSKGVKEMADINALCDEYLRLSYHGLRAKDNSFNVDFKTSFDESIRTVKLVPQDMGRVLLNLFNNAFYAVNKKKQTAGKDYTPFVSVSTKKRTDTVDIVVADNGSGVPAHVIDKIFQPFFTTKPAGQGTGLGLSLAYDIITKEHGGTIRVENKEGEGTQFVIQIPM